MTFTKSGRTSVCIFIFIVLTFNATIAFADGLPAYEPDATAGRETVPDAYKWDLDQLFPSDEAWESALLQLTEELTKLERFQGKLADPSQLLACVEHYFSIHDAINHVTLYANLKSTCELSNDTFLAMQSRSLSLMEALMATASFMRSEILALSSEQMNKAYQQQPALQKHRSYLENLLRRQSRVLSAESERILLLAGDNLWAEIDLNEIPSSLEETFGALLSDISWPVVHNEEGEEVQMTLANYSKFRGSSNREVRKEAVAAFFSTLRQFQHAFAATLGGQYEFSVFLARARGYDSAIDAYLDKDDLSADVYRNLIKTINANLEPLHQYVELRRKALGYDELHLYDLYVPFVGEVDKEVSFEEARKILPEALKPLGKEYVDPMNEGMDPKNGWIDLYPSNDKRSGAFSASVYGRHPYVMMNYQNSSNDLSTLAHEFGHAVHSHLAMHSQPYSAYRYVPFLAEIASTCNEALLQKHLIKNASSKEEKASLLADKLESMRTTIYRQALFAEFELAVHTLVEEGNPITATLLERTYSDLVSKYYGPGYVMDENDGMEWAYIPHFYYKYYVFTYATGLSSGIALADIILNGDQSDVDNYLSMFKGGCSKPPLELLAAAGVDLTRPDAIEKALEDFANTVKELEGLLAD